MQDEITHSDLEWHNRVLCSDESCIGTIGADGHCTECGKAYEGELPLALADLPAESPAESRASVSPSSDSSQSDAGSETGSDGDQEWRERILCPDEACIGVIGPDGRCKECGLALKA